MEKIDKKSIKKKMAAIRERLHEDILEELKNSECKMLQVLREPNTSKKQPAPKIIIATESEEKASLLLERCSALVSNANDSLKKLSQQAELPHHEIKYKLSAIKVQSDLALSLTPAQRRKKVSGTELKKKLKAMSQRFQFEQELEGAFLGTEHDRYANQIKYINNIINKINEKKYYIFAEPTGFSYRVTFFDGERRRQVSAGNILIVISESADTKVLIAPERKIRCDKKKWLYCVGTEDSVVYIFPSAK